MHACVLPLNGLKIVTFNCHGFKSSVYDILLLCEQFDVILLQELWLSCEDISLLRSIHKAFEAYAVSAMNDQLGIQVGRPFGGIGVLWTTSISHACTICDLQDNRLLGIDIDTNDGKLFNLNVYLPYQTSHNFEELYNYLGTIASIIEEKDTTNVVITGDFKAAINTPFLSELIAMCEKTTLYLDGMIMLRKRTLKLDMTIFYGVIWENLSMAQYVN